MTMRILGKILMQVLTGILILSVLQISPAFAKKTLYLYNWNNYIDPAIVSEFEKKYDVNVSISLFGNNSEMFAKLRAGGDRQYDVIVPTGYYVPRLVHAGLVQPLNKNLIPNMENLIPRLKDPEYDPGNKYSVPYQWGDTGIAYNTENISKPPRSWSILFDTKVNPDYPFMMLNSSNIMFGAACAYLGFGYDCMGKSKWKKAAKLLLETKERRNFVGYANGLPALRQLVRGNASVAVVYNGDFVSEKIKNPASYRHIKFVVPKEGSQMWVDTMAIPKHAPHPELANKFINFILEPKIGAQLSNAMGYSSPNKASLPYLRDALAKPPSTPTDETLNVLRFTPSLKGKDLKYVSQLWTSIKSQ